MSLIQYKNTLPNIAPDVFVADGAKIIGDVEILDGSSVWFNAVVRGDINYIRIGKMSNIQDNSVLHVNHDTQPLYIGDYVTVGHNCILHSCRLEAYCLIGMGACVLDGAIVESNAFVGAGALVPPGMRIPAGMLAVGVPAKVVRALSDEEVKGIANSAHHYFETSRNYI